MKIAYPILLIVGCTVAQGTNYASVSNPVGQQNTGNSTTAVSDGSIDREQATLPGQVKNHKTASAERADSRRIFGKIQSPHARMIKASRRKVLHESGERPTSENVMGVRQVTSTKPGGSASKVAANRAVPIQPATGTAISGEHVQNGRNRGSIPAAIGGPAGTRRNTATLSGTEVNRKHLN